MALGRVGEGVRARWALAAYLNSRADGGAFDDEDDVEGDGDGGCVGCSVGEGSSRMVWRTRFNLARSAVGSWAFLWSRKAFFARQNLPTSVMWVAILDLKEFWVFPM